MARVSDSRSRIDVELFAGAGGLTLGLQCAGFVPAYMFDLDPHSCANLEANHVSKGGVLHGEIREGDIRKIDWRELDEPVRLLAGGAPCQPFSLAGKHLADEDGRNLFPEVFRALRLLRPLALILENVQGLTRPSFRPYFEYLLRQLECPSVAPKRRELWQQHDARIKLHHGGSDYRPEYHVRWSVLNAADYGVPQTRRRVFFVATRADLFPPYKFPEPTHDWRALLRDLENGRYWKRHRVKPRSIQATKGRWNGTFDLGADLGPWRTVRDGLKGLPHPAPSEGSARKNHWLIHGARLYRGHQGCRLDWPAKTIKAGVHGVPGGENIVLLDDGSHRYFTLRETARVQGFPDDYFFVGARSHVTRQIGNAVPPPLAEAVARPLFLLLQDGGDHSK